MAYSQSYSQGFYQQGSYTTSTPLPKQSFSSGPVIDTKAEPMSRSYSNSTYGSSGASSSPAPTDYNQENYTYSPNEATFTYPVQQSFATPRGMADLRYYSYEEPYDTYPGNEE